MKVIAVWVGLLVGLTACTIPIFTQAGDVPATPETGMPPDTVELLSTPAAGSPTLVRSSALLIGSPDLLSIHMFDEFSGWGVSETQVLRTEDGGAHWYRVTPESLIRSGSGFQATFLDIVNAWMLIPDMNNFPNAGLLYRTSDGGLTWESTATPFSGGSMKFIDNQNGWMMADLGVGAGSNAVAVFQSGDGGETWSQTYINDPTQPGAADSLPLGGLKSSLSPVDMKRAFIGGVIYAPGEVYLFETQDRGRRWEQVTLQLPSDLGTSELAVEQLEFVSPSAGFLVVRVSGGRSYKIVYATRDAGMTWSLTPTRLSQEGHADFISVTDAVIYSDGRFGFTRDALQTSRTITPDVRFGENIASMDFVDPSSGWVITSEENGERALYQTTDGGATWILLE